MKNTTYASAIVLGLASLALVSLTVACGDDDATPTTSSSSSSGSTTSSSGSTTSSSGSTTSSSSSSGGGDPAKDALKATCTKNEKCQPNTFKAEFASVDACVTAYAALTSTATPVEFPGANKDCAAKQTAAACGETAPECLKGTGAKDAPCNFDNQCAGVCKKAAAADKCGKCADAPKVDDACGVTFTECGFGLGLRCDATAKKCIKTLDDGADCSAPADAAGCNFPSTCDATTKKCTGPKKGDIGATCATATATTDCRSGLSCDGGKCADVAPKFLDADAACDPAKFATERCKTGLACDATAKKCQKPAAAPAIEVCK